MQARAQFMLGETYVEELRLANTEMFLRGSGAIDPRKALDHATNSDASAVGANPISAKATADPTGGTSEDEMGGSHASRRTQHDTVLDPRTMGIPTAACRAEVSSEVAGEIALNLSVPASVPGMVAIRCMLIGLLSSVLSSLAAGRGDHPGLSDKRRLSGTAQPVSDQREKRGIASLR